MKKTKELLTERLQVCLTRTEAEQIHKAVKKNKTNVSMEIRKRINFN